MKTVPYTYLIGWSSLNFFYYGVRYGKGCDPSDLWITYFTSSKYVKEFRTLHGEPDKIEIRSTFESSEEARNWEERVLKIINAAQNPNFLNKANGKSIAPEFAAHYGPRPPNLKAGLKMKGIPKTETHKAALRGPRPHINQTGPNNNNFKRWYITPWGKYGSVSEAFKVCPFKELISVDRLYSYCINNTMTIEKITSSKYFTPDMIGKTFLELGYSIESKA
jgi:hypothetical protein